MEFKAADKYRQMLRSYDRVRKIATNNGNSISNVESRDSVEDFFNQAYHLKDWLKKDSRVTLTSDVENYISESSALSLAADYCNSFKHAGLDKKSRSGRELEQLNTHMKLELTPNGFIASSTLTVTISGEKYDALTLADDCVAEWDKFLQLNKVVFPDP